MSEHSKQPTLPLQLPFLDEHKTSRQRKLEKLAQIVDFEKFRPLLNKLCRFKDNGRGRRHYDVVQMFRVLVLQNMYGLSDEQMEDEMREVFSFRAFLMLGSDTPDARTIWAFRNKLGAEGVKELFDHFNGMLQEAGVTYSKGTIIDSSFHEAPRQRNSREENAHIKETHEAPEEWSEEKRRHKDIDATWTRKGGVTYFGTKNHVAVDEGTKLIRNYVVGTASQHDSRVCEDLMPEGTEEMLADSAYAGEEREARLRERGIEPLIVERRRRGQPELTEAQRRKNAAITPRRSRVEHVFGAIRHMKGDIVRCVGIARARIRIGLVNLAYNMLRLCQLTSLTPGVLCPQH